MKVLIVDDNKQIISILEAYAKKEGYQTVIAVDGQEALDVFQRERPDIILLDVMMPKIDVYKRQILEGVVTGITKFGAFVELPGGKVGLVHISEVADVYVKDVNDFLKEKDKVKVKVLSVDDQDVYKRQVHSFIKSFFI